MTTTRHTETIGHICQHCGCFHDETYARHHDADDVLQLRAACPGFDPQRPCRVCKQPVAYMSTGGSSICPWCDAGQNRDGTKKD